MQGSARKDVVFGQRGCILSPYQGQNGNPGLKPIPFEFSVTGDEKDFGLPARLQREAPGILTWAVSGCQRWLKEGLGEIPDVQEARQTWRDECDPLSEFLADECELEPGNTEVYVFAAEMRTRYESWCKENGELRPLSRKRFAERLRALGCSDGRRPDEMGKRHRTWGGSRVEMTPDRRTHRGTIADISRLGRHGTRPYHKKPYTRVYRKSFGILTSRGVHVPT